LELLFRHAAGLICLFLRKFRWAPRGHFLLPQQEDFAALSRPRGYALLATSCQDVWIEIKCGYTFISINASTNPALLPLRAPHVARGPGTSPVDARATLPADARTCTMVMLQQN
jgi:hypothetical protein